jgi:hypothetical protein
MNYNLRTNALVSRVGIIWLFTLAALPACKTTTGKEANLASTSQAMSDSLT